MKNTINDYAEKIGPFQVGDRVVVVVNSNRGVYEGLTGKIVFIDEKLERPICVEWDMTHPAFGTCNGHTPRYSGSFVVTNIIKKVGEPTEERGHHVLRGLSSAGFSYGYSP